MSNKFSTARLPVLPLKVFAFLPLVAFVSFSSCTSKTTDSEGTSSSSQRAIIRIDGSSTVFPVTEAVAEEFQKNHQGKIQVTVGISGTGGGFKRFCRGETDVQNASRPILQTELDDCKKNGVEFFELPVAYDAIAIVVNPKNTWLKQITVDELKKIWEPAAQGKITRWNQVNPTWPDKPLKLYAPGADSGTFDYFTEAIMGKSKASRGDFAASEDDNTIVQGISSDENSLGYFGLAYYENNRNRVRAVPVVGGPKSPKKDEAILPTKEAVKNATYFPLSRPAFVYVNAKSITEKPEVKSFIEFYTHNSEKLVLDVNYIPLPTEAYKMAWEHILNNKRGTAFKGHVEVGLPVEELLKKERSL